MHHCQALVRRRTGRPTAAGDVASMIFRLPRALRRVAHRARSGAVVSLLVLAGGCASATVDRPVVQSLGNHRTPATDAASSEPPTQPAGASADAGIDDLDFWHTLGDRAITSYDDAFHALLLFAGGDDTPTSDYAARVATLKQKGLLARSFNRPANEAVDRGTLAVALAKELKIRGGLVMSVFGPSARYATKELEYLAVYPPSSPNQTFSGSEFLAVMSRAEDYQRQAESKSPTGGPSYVPPELEVRREPLKPALPAPDAVPAAPTTRPSE